MLRVEPHSKLDPLQVGPWKVVRRNKGGTYVLADATGKELGRSVPLDLLVVHWTPNSVNKLPIPMQHVWEVEAILGHRSDGAGGYEYQCKWKHFPASENTREPPTSFRGTRMIKEYWKNQPKSVKAGVGISK